MKRYLFSLSCLLVCCILNATELTVKEFVSVPLDISARTQVKQDINGDMCALIRIYIPADNVSFDNSMIVETVKIDANEYWIYMAQGAKKLTIKVPGYTALVDLQFSQYGIASLEKGMTYKMVVDAPPLSEKSSNRGSQYLEFHVTPNSSNAKIVIDGDNEEHYVDKDGVYFSVKKFGKYQYTVSAKDYYSESNTVVVNDPDNKQEVYIILKAKFGYLHISNKPEYNGATLIIDGSLYEEQLPVSKNIKLSKGFHNIQIVKENYETQYSQVYIPDGEMVEKLDASMTARFKNLSIDVENGDDADIYIDEKKIGKGSVDYPLGYGPHILYAYKDNHTKTEKEIDFSANSSTKIVLPAPKPIMGTFNITSEPNGADIFIDGKFTGKHTPEFVDCIIGKHKITLSKSAYIEYSVTVDLLENTTKEVNGILEKQNTDGLKDTEKSGVWNGLLSIGSDAYVTIYDNGIRLGDAPQKYVATIGKHTIKLMKGNDILTKTTVTVERDDTIYMYYWLKNNNWRIYKHNSNSSYESSLVNDDEHIYMIAEENPEFPGGSDGLNQYFQYNMRYPLHARELGIEGKVICQFTVRKDGTVRDVEVLRSSGDATLDAEAVRLVSRMPKWKPGKQQGKAVHCKFRVPVAFRITR